MRAEKAYPGHDRGRIERIRCRYELLEGSSGRTPRFDAGHICFRLCPADRGLGAHRPHAGAFAHAGWPCAVAGHAVSL